VKQLHSPVRELLRLWRRHGLIDLNGLCPKTILGRPALTLDDAKDGVWNLVRLMLAQALADSASALHIFLDPQDSCIRAQEYRLATLEYRQRPWTGPPDLTDPEATWGGMMVLDLSVSFPRNSIRQAHSDLS